MIQWKKIEETQNAGDATECYLKRRGGLATRCIKALSVISIAVDKALFTSSCDGFHSGESHVVFIALLLADLSHDLEHLLLLVPWLIYVFFDRHPLQKRKFFVQLILDNNNFLGSSKLERFIVIIHLSFKDLRFLFSDIVGAWS